MTLWTFVEAQITNIEMNSHALLEIAPGIHSPVCPYLVEFSACVPPALHMGMTYDFHIGDLGFYKGPLSHFYQWSAWQLFFVSIQARNSSDIYVYLKYNLDIKMCKLEIQKAVYFQGISSCICKNM